MEQDEGFPIARGSNIEAVYKTLTGAGIMFVPENGGGVGIRLQKRPGESTSESKPAAGTKTAPAGKTHQRASKGSRKR